MNECYNQLFLTEKEAHRIELAVKINRLKPTHSDPFTAKEYYICPFKNVDKNTCNIENIKPRYCTMKRQGEYSAYDAMHLSFCQCVNAREAFFNEKVQFK